MSRLQQTRRALRNTALVAFVAAGLAACGGGGGDKTVAVTPPTPPPPATLQSMFGAGFATLFSAGANTDPGNPMTSDVIALSLTTDPIRLR